MRALAAIVISVLAGCGVFEEPSIVLDLRVVGMVAEPPEQVVPVDLSMPMISQLADDLRPTEISAYVADPRQVRPLRWSMTLCLVDEEGRCDPSEPHKELGGGVIEDPEEATSAQVPSAELYSDLTHLTMLQRAIEANPVQAIGGVDLTVMFRVGGVDDPPEDDVYAAKLVRVAPEFPALRKENNNPNIQLLDAARPGGGLEVDIVERRCGDPLRDGELPTYLPTGGTVTLFPVETDSTREQYLAPTLDGQSIMLEETISYQWLAEAGSWSDETTGGGHDVLGNQSLLGSDWTAPRTIPTDEYPVSIWMIQRDERLGARVFETCIVVRR